MRLSVECLLRFAAYVMMVEPDILHKHSEGLGVRKSHETINANKWLQINKKVELNLVLLKHL